MANDKKFSMAYIREIFLLLSAFVLWNTSCNPKNKAEQAGMEYCECLKNNVGLGKDSAVRKCKNLVNEKYKYLQIYENTRDTNISELYDANIVKKINFFVDEFARTVDKCSPPYWFKESK